VARGGRGQDSIGGGPKADRIFGGPGRDGQLWGQSGTGDFVSGGAGDDSCVSTWDRDGDDIVVGGPGHDIFFADPGDTRRSVEQSAGCIGD
jgi:hypothetical protein